MLWSRLQVLLAALHAVATWRYSMIAAYVVCFYDWVISLDQEVALIYPAPWNAVKVAYLFCRYYPLAIAPFHIWGLVGDHEESVCETYYRVLYACAMPTLLSAQFILMLRTYAFSGRKTQVLVVLSIAYSGLAGVIIWVLSKELNLAHLFSVTKRNACFAISDVIAPVARVSQGMKAPAPFSYHIGMISVLAAFFDCLNILVVLWYWVRGRDTFGPLGKSFLKQGMLVYVVMTALNALSVFAFLSSYLVLHGLAASALIAYIMPSALACRLVLMLRQKASPTETKLRLEYSHMVDYALEMIAVDRCPEELSDGFTPSISTDAEAQH